MKLSKRKAPMNTILLAMIYDYFAGANEGYVRILPTLYEVEEEDDEAAYFATGADFEEKRRKILGG